MIPQTTAQKIAKLTSKFRSKAKSKNHIFGIVNISKENKNINLICNLRT